MKQVPQCWHRLSAGIRDHPPPSTPSLVASGSGKWPDPSLGDVCRLLPRRQPNTRHALMVAAPQGHMQGHLVRTCSHHTRQRAAGCTCIGASHLTNALRYTCSMTKGSESRALPQGTRLPNRESGRKPQLQGRSSVIGPFLQSHPAPGAWPWGLWISRSPLPSLTACSSTRPGQRGHPEKSTRNRQTGCEPGGEGRAGVSSRPLLAGPRPSSAHASTRSSSPRLQRKLGGQQGPPCGDS